MPSFSHLHVHTQFSLLDGAADVGNLYKKAVADNMPALAITDHGNMFGVFEFVAEAYKHKLNPDDKNDNRLKVKPIVGCEFYLVEDRHKRQFTRGEKDVRYHQLMLAKNEVGYKNLSKLCSLGYIEGMYGKYPRIDKQLVLKYHEGLIATTCCLGAEVPRTIISKGEKEAEKVFKWWLDIFGEDYYVEIQRHGIPEQDIVNRVLLDFARKHNVKVIASNDSHYVDQDDYNAHDILLCINTGEKKSTPTIKEFADDDINSKGKRFAFYNDQFYFKKTGEMAKVFSDVPESLDNTNEIVGKVDQLNLFKDILLPNFVIPEGFRDQDDYLRDLTYKGAKERYKDITAEVEERLNFELHTIKTMGFAGYFLIVSDFIKAGRDLGVFVGPGRGSAAGSAVAYCIGITNIDPIKYQLLFERFLNPDRKSMPDIDTDFDDIGRQKVIEYVVDKYGKNQVAHIITYGTMAAKMSIKDVARVMDLPLPDANKLAKLVPERPGIKLNRVLKAPITGEGSLKEKEELREEDLALVRQLREIFDNTGSAESEVLHEAIKLEGSVRNTGIHAAGVIIAPKDLTDLIPVCTARDADLLVTQFEGNVIESAGVIKMDILGLKTLTIIKDALALVKKNKGIDLDIDEIPLDDPLTLELYQKGETTGTFQFESPGMQKYLRELVPDKFADLIAMNALYRPGPLEYIPKFIARKHGKEAVAYDLAEMEEYLSDTYGITVYQEQVMLLSQKLANFTKGDADTLRKAMGKKQKAVLDKMKSQFMEGCKTNGHEPKICEKIWTDWEAFASYAFNKSHSTCYAYLAFQTAYLKAHYPSEYMAAVLNNANSIEKITFFMMECKRMGLEVLGTDINESEKGFSANKKGKIIRFGLASLKGVGEGPVNEIIRERDEKGPFKDIYDFVKRVNLRAVNKKCLESLIYSGAFDSFTEIHRAQFFAVYDKNNSFLEYLVKFGTEIQNRSNAPVSLFGSMETDTIPAPIPPKTEEFPLITKLNLEKDVAGIYLNGNPLDDYRVEIENFVRNKISDIEDYKDRNIRLAMFISSARHAVNTKGNGYARIVGEDYSGSMEFSLFGEDYQKFKHLLEEGKVVCVEGIYRYSQGFGKWELRVNSISQMEELSARLTKSITIKIPIHHLDEKLIASLDAICNDFKGTNTLKFQVFNQEDQSLIQFSSVKRNVKADSHFVRNIEGLGLRYKLN